MVNTPGFKKSVTMVAIMDIVCRQIDRHGGNFIYQYDNKGKHKWITGNRQRFGFLAMLELIIMENLIISKSVL